MKGEATVRRGTVAGEEEPGVLRPVEVQSASPPKRRRFAWLGGERAEGESEARVRRPSDLLLGAVSLGAIAIVMLAAHSAPHTTRRATSFVFRAAPHLPRVAVFVVAVLAAVATLAVLAAIGIVLVRRRRLDGVNAIIAGALTAVLAAGEVAAWHAFRGGISAVMLHGTDGSSFLRDAVIVALITGSDTARYHRWARATTTVLLALFLTGLALDEITIFSALVAAAGGYGVGLGVRFSLRTTVRRPSSESLVAGLRLAGVPVGDLVRPTPDSQELCGNLENGRPIVLKAAGREVHGAGLVHRLWSVVRLRGAATGRQPISLRAALETEALACLMASNTGVVAPRVLLLAHFEPDTLVLARERLDAPAIDGTLSDAEAAELFRSLRLLHLVGVAARDLRSEQLIVAPLPDGTTKVGFRSLENAVVGAGELVRRLDLAQLITALGTLLGAERAVRALHEGYAAVDDQAVAAILQPVALSSWGWSKARASRSCLADVRSELIGETPRAIPVTRLERFRWKTVLAVVALVAAAFLLVGQLSKVNLVGALAKADWAWFAVALAGSALTYLGSSLNLVAFVPQKVSALKGALVELSGAFIGLVTPASVGHVAVNGRFLHKQGVDGAVTASAVALSQLVNFLATVFLLVVMALLSGTGVGRLKIVPSPRLLAVLGGIVGVGILLITVVPWTKELFWRRLWPRIKGVWPQLLEVLSQPLRLAQGIGGNILLTASYALALIASLHAVGAHPPIIATAAVFMAGNAVGAAAPTPGGLGAVETVLIAGLTAVGIPAHEAVPGVLLFRIATFWLPIAPGYALFVILQKKNVL